jgi:hypothetical protein
MISEEPIGGGKREENIGVGDKVVSEKKGGKVTLTGGKGREEED